MRVFIGIDNGVTGSIGIIREDGFYVLHRMTTKSELSYTKKKQNITRVDGIKLSAVLCMYAGDDVKIAIERPFVNPGMFKSTLSAIRCLEATITVIESFKFFSYKYIDSKEWQKVLLPAGCEGPELKIASLEIGKRLFPKIDYDGLKMKDADGILIAEYLRRSYVLK